MRNGATADTDAETLASVSGVPFIATGTNGSGRTVGVNYKCTGDYSLLLPNHDPEITPHWGDYYEPVYALYLKALAWAAGKEPRVALTVPDVTVTNAGDEIDVTLSLKRVDESAPTSVTVEHRLKDAFGNCLDDGVSDAVAITTNGVEYTPDLPALYATNGIYRLDLWVKYDDKIENWGCTAIRIENGTQFSMEALQNVGIPGSSVWYRVDTDAVGARLSVQGIDGMDRIFFSTNVFVADEDEIEVDLARSCLPGNRIEFTLKNRAHVIGRTVHPLYVPRIGLDSFDNEFMVACYSHTTSEHHLDKYMGAISRASGINTVYHPSHERRFGHAVVDRGLFHVAGTTWTLRQFSLTNELALCPNKPTSRDSWTNHIATLAVDVSDFGGVGRVFGDEVYHSYVEHSDDVYGAQSCQCVYCLDLFRTAMSNKYGTISALNDMWGTNFASFAAIEVVEEDDIADSDNPSGWVEFRDYMNWTYAHQYFGWLTAQHTNTLGADYGAGPGAPAWLKNEGGPTYKGGDYEELPQVMEFVMGYGGLESLVFPDAYVSQFAGAHYGPGLIWSEYGSWRQLFNGADGLWYYDKRGIMGSELAWRRQNEWIKRATEDIVDGAGLLVSRAKPLKSGVKFFYSSENMAMSWLFRKRDDAYAQLDLVRWEGSSTTRVLGGANPISHRALWDLLQQVMFLTPELITADDIAGGGLDDCDLLVLPYAFNMDDATASSISNYVYNGGYVVADVMPATRERMGKPRTESALSDVFGVEFDGAAPYSYPREPAYEFAGLHLNETQNLFATEEIWLPAEVAFTNITPVTAEAQGMVDFSSQGGPQPPAYLVNTFGSGKALLLNFVYCDMLAENVEEHRKFGNALVEWAGLDAPPARVLDPVSGEALAYRPLYAFEQGDALLLGSIRGKVFWNYAAGSYPDLVDFGVLADSNTPDNAVFEWTTNRYVYDVREQSYLGYGTNVQIDLPSYEGRLLALLPYAVTNVAVTAPATNLAGQVVTVQAAVEASATPGKHLLRMTVYSPTGEKRPLYCRSLFWESGQVDFEIPFADNDPPGTWTIVIRDSLSGVETSFTIELTAIPDVPAILFLSPKGTQGYVDLDYLTELYAAGFEVDFIEDVTEFRNDITWDRIKDYNVLVIYATIDGYNVSTAHQSSDPATITNFVNLIEDYLDQGGGVFLHVPEVNLIKQLAIDLTDRWGAQLPTETISDSNANNIVKMPRFLYGTTLAFTDQVVTNTPVSANVTQLWYPHVPAYNGAHGGPLAVDSNWQVVVRGSATSYTTPVDMNVTDMIPDPFFREGGVTQPDLFAIRSLSAGRVALNWQWQTYSIGSGTGWLYDRAVLDKGLDGRPSHYGRLLENTFRWLAEPSLTNGNLGGYVMPEDRLIPYNLTADGQQQYVNANVPYDYDPDTLDEVAEPARTIYKGLIGARTSYSSGSSTVAEYAAAATNAGLDFVVFLEELSELTESEFDQLKADCISNSTASLVLLPGFCAKVNIGNHTFLFGEDPTWPPDIVFSDPTNKVLELQEETNGVYTGLKGPLPFWALEEYGFTPRAQVGYYNFTASTNGMPLSSCRFYSATALRYYRDGSLVEDLSDAYLTTADCNFPPEPYVINEVSSAAALTSEASGSNALMHVQATALDAGSLMGVLRWCTYYSSHRVFPSDGPLIHEWANTERLWAYASESFNRNLAVMEVPIYVTASNGLKRIDIYNGSRHFRRFTFSGETEFKKKLLLDRTLQQMLILIAEDQAGRIATSSSRRNYKDGAGLSWCHDHVNNGPLYLAHGPMACGTVTAPALHPNTTGYTWDGGSPGSNPSAGDTGAAPHLTSDAGTEDGRWFDQVPIHEFSDEGALAVRSEKTMMYSDLLPSIHNVWHTFGPIDGPSELMTFSQSCRVYGRPIVDVAHANYAAVGEGSGGNVRLSTTDIEFRTNQVISKLRLGYTTAAADVDMVIGTNTPPTGIDLSQGLSNTTIDYGDWWGYFKPSAESPCNALILFNRSGSIRLYKSGYIYKRGWLIDSSTPHM